MEISNAMNRENDRIWTPKIPLLSDSTPQALTSQFLVGSLITHCSCQLSCGDHMSTYECLNTLLELESCFNDRDINNYLPDESILCAG